MKIAYADPPYLGQARKHYRHDPQCAEVDHAALFVRLATYDGWAMSCSSPSLEVLLPMAPRGYRIAAWLKPFASFKPGVNPAYTWEPVIYSPARPGRRDVPTVRDHHVASITLRKALAGAKPKSFCLWLFDLLGAEAGDHFDDLYPGTGIVMTAWNERWDTRILSEV